MHNDYTSAEKELLEQYGLLNGRPTDVVPINQFAEALHTTRWTLYRAMSNGTLGFYRVHKNRKLLLMYARAHVLKNHHPGH